MRSDAPPLLPILRSRHLAELLTLLLIHPDREYTLTDLSQRLDSPLTTVQREVARLATAGIVTTRRVGRSRMVRADPAGRYFAPLSALVIRAFGPNIAVGEEFADIAGLDAVGIYGSWAARYFDRPGPPPNDVDVLVIGEPDRDQLYAAAERTEQRVSLPVNPTVCGRLRWIEGSDAFVRQLKSEPLLWVHGTEPTGGSA